MFIVILLVFIGICIYHACEKELPADYHRNWKLEQEDANKVRFGEMSRSQFIKNMNHVGLIIIIRMWLQHSKGKTPTKQTILRNGQRTV